MHHGYSTLITLLHNFTSIYTSDDSYLEEVHLKDGIKVKRGELIATFSSPELEIDIKETLAKLAQIEALKLNAQKNIADLKPLDARVKLLKKRVLWQQERKKKLRIYAQ